MSSAVCFQARVAVEDLDKARDDFEHVLKLDPGNKEARQQLQLVNKKIRQHTAKEKSIYGELFLYCYVACKLRLAGEIGLLIFLVAYSAGGQMKKRACSLSWNTRCTHRVALCPSGVAPLAEIRDCSQSTTFKGSKLNSTLFLAIFPVFHFIEKSRAL